MSNKSETIVHPVYGVLQTRRKVANVRKLKTKHCYSKGQCPRREDRQVDETVFSVSTVNNAAVALVYAYRSWQNDGGRNATAALRAMLRDYRTIETMRAHLSALPTNMRRDIDGATIEFRDIERAARTEFSPRTITVKVLGTGERKVEAIDWRGLRREIDITRPIESLVR